jgi:two-component system response regulator AtoC
MARVLVVDDEASIRQVFSHILRLDKHEVGMCSSGEEALELLKTNEYDIMLSDIRMQGMSGIALLKIVRELYPKMLTIMATAYGSLETAVSAMEHDAFDYLQKPFKPEDLRLTVRRAAEYQKLMSENDSLRKSIDAGSILEEEVDDSAAGRSLKAYLRAKEKEYITYILDQCEGDKGVAAERLGVSLATFYRKYSGNIS